MRPNAAEHRQDPEYFSQLVESAGMSQGELAKIIGHDARTLRRWMTGERKFPYSVQFIVECVVLDPG